MKKYLFLFAFFGFLLQGCMKTATNPDHVNKFTCKVNGAFWEAIPFQNFILGNDLQMTKSPFFDIGAINAFNAKKNQSIVFNFSLSDTMKVSNITVQNPFSGLCNLYFLDTLSTRSVKVTEHDKIKKIVKGTFSFRVIDVIGPCKDTVTVTDGFFDMHYSAQ
jgi:hypothetical protein